jgi:hypothetical protein
MPTSPPARSSPEPPRPAPSTTRPARSLTRPVRPIARTEIHGFSPCVHRRSQPLPNAFAEHRLFREGRTETFVERPEPSAVRPKPSVAPPACPFGHPNRPAAASADSPASGARPLPVPRQGPCSDGPRKPPDHGKPPTPHPQPFFSPARLRADAPARGHCSSALSRAERNARRGLLLFIPGGLLAKPRRAAGNARAHYVRGRERR